MTRNSNGCVGNIYTVVVKFVGWSLLRL